MGSVGANRNAVNLTRTERLVNLIADEVVQSWIDDSYMDDDEKETILNWHDLLEHLGMEASEAKEAIIEDLWDRADTWRPWYEKPKNISEEDKKLIFMDNEFEDENGNFIKYGEIMKQVKKRLAEKGIMQRGN